MADKIEYALLAANVYGVSSLVRSSRNTLPMPAGWSGVATPAFAETGQELADGFMARAYRKGTEIVISYAGTTNENALDWITGNLPAATATVLASQIVDAARFYLEVLKANPTATISFTGHSLGGGLASVMAVLFNRDARVFDEAPFQKTADSATMVNTLKLRLAAEGYTLPADFLGYVAVDPTGSYLPSPTRLSRQARVQQVYVVGEILSVASTAMLNALAVALGFVNPAFWIAGIGVDKVQNGSPIAYDPKAKSMLGWGPSFLDGDPVALHSMSLLAGFELSAAFFDAVVAYPELLPRIFAGLYTFEPKDAEHATLLDLLVAREYRGEGSLAMLATDVNKIDTQQGLGSLKTATDSGGNEVEANVAAALIDVVLAGLYAQGKGRLPTQTNQGQFEAVLTVMTGGLSADLSTFGSEAARAESSLFSLAEKIGGPDYEHVTHAKGARWTLQNGGDALQADFSQDAKVDFVVGYGQGDSITGGAGADRLLGLDGADSLLGGEGRDELLGGLGADTLDGGAGRDYLYGGAGDDRYDVKRGEMLDFILDADGNGSIWVVGQSQITGGKKVAGMDGFWISDDRQWTFVISGSGDLVITGAGSTDSITIREWGTATRSKLGITLDDAETQAPPTQNTFRGDFVKKMQGGSIVIGGDGNYIADGDQPGALDLITGTAQNDVIQGLDGADGLLGAAGDDSIEGGAGVDVLQGGLGADTLLGGAGDDLIYGSSNGWLTYPTDPDYGANVPAFFDIEIGRGFSWVRSAPGYDADGFLIGYLTNTVGRDEQADDQGNYIDGGDGDDVIYSGTGADLVFGGEGRDDILGMAGADVIFSEAGADRVYGDGGVADGSVTQTPAEQHGADIIDGGDGADLLYGQGSDDHVYGGAGNDVMYGDDIDAERTPNAIHGNDYLDGEGDDDRMFGGGLDDQMFGGAGNDEMWGDEYYLNGIPGELHGYDYLDGEDGDDSMWGGGRDDTLFGGIGSDVLYGDDPLKDRTPEAVQGEDYLDGEEGNDSLVGGARADVLFGGDGNDALWGDDGGHAPGETGASDPALDGADYLDGEAGDDELVGEGGADELFGGSGNDLLFGDDTTQRLAVAFHGNDYLDGEEGNDTLQGNGGNDILFGGTGLDELQGGIGDDQLDGEEDDDRLFGEEGNDFLDGGSGRDLLVGGSGSDTLYGDTGNDLLAGDTGSDLLDGGDNNDELQGGADNDTLGGGGGDDLLFGEAGADLADGGDGNDQVQGGEGNDTVGGGGGDDLVFGDVGDDLVAGGEGRDELQGGAGNDVLDGGSDNDVLFGMDGLDTLEGGAGDDTLQGDAGADTYVFGYGGGHDTIYNFETNGGPTDVLQFKGANAGDVYAYRDGADQVYRLKGSDDTIRVKNYYVPTRSVYNQFTGSYTYYYDYRVERITFADGTSWTPDTTPQYVEGQIGGGATGSGTSRNDTFAPSISGNSFYGGAGSDTYLWGTHTGRTTVSEDSTATDRNTILVDASVSVADVRVRREGTDAVLTIRNSPDEIRIYGGVSSSNMQVKFESDGTLWNLHDQFARATEGADDIYGTSGNDSIDALGGNDTIDSAWGVDTVRGGDGDDRITTTGSGQLYGDAGNDTITGGSSGGGTVTLDGGDGNDVLTSTASGGTLIYGGAGNDTMTAYYSYYYSNVVYGGTGDDVLIDDFGLANFIENAGEGRDTVIVNNGYTLGANVENVTIRYSGLATGNALDNAITGGMYDNTLVGAAGNDTLDGAQGWDQLDGGAGDDTYLFARGGQSDTIVNEADGTGTLDRIVFAQGIAVADIAVQRAGNDLVLAIRGTADQLRVTGYFAGAGTIEQVQFADGTVWDAAAIQAAVSFVPTEGDDVLGGTAGNDSIAALGGNDTVSGYGGDDTLDGGTGIDSLVGGAGNDLYIVDSGSDVVSELAGEGVDTVQSAASYTLAAEVENLVLTGSALTGTGNALDNLLVGTGGANTLTGGAGADTLDGAAGTDSLAGGAGDDTYVVDTATDVISEAAGGGTDTVRASYSYTLDAGNLLENLVLTGAAATGTGNGLANSITGNAGANTLNGMAGIDTLAGGDGNDTYIVADTGDVVVENAGQGYDTVQSSVTYTLGANVEALTLTGTAAINGTGNAGDNTLTGNSGANVLAGGAGNDFYVVSAGDTVNENLNEGTDTVQTDVAVAALWANVENVTLTGSARVNITGNALNNVIVGNVSNNALSGGDGDDRLDGGGGTDTLTGGKGNDYFVIDDSRDVVNELAAEGTDTIEASFSYTLGSTNVVENLVITGAATTATGNGVANVLTGNNLANTLSGLAGNDTMIGLGGDDTYVVAETGDVVIEEAGQGIDLVQSAVSYTLSANVENLTLTGTAASNGTGNALDNVLTGNTAANALAGGAGNDTYVVGAGDTVAENAGEGVDTVQSSVTYTLGSHLENLTLTGTGVINGTGNALDNVLTGNGSANVLAGGQGDDTYFIGAGDTVTELAGEGTDTVMSSVAYTLAANLENLTLTGTTAINGGGNDLDNVLTGNSAINQLSGGKGNDTYVVGTGDTIVEALDAGIDTVRADVSFSIAAFANVENLTLTTAAAATATGNGLANLIVGGDGNNTLDGGSGADTLRGGLGDDTYVIDNAGDVVIENAGEGSDTIQTSLSFVSGGNIENITLSGTGNVNATGDGTNNVLTGNTGANVLTGNGGDDTLNGGGGSDTLAGGAGNDTYVFAAGVTMTENADEGIDTVQTSVTYTLDANFENATLTGTAVANLTGNALDNLLTGNGAANVLDGSGAGVDTLIGGAGNDTLYGNYGDQLRGGLGDDTYILTGGAFTQVYTDWEYGAGSDGIDSVTADFSLYLYDYSYWSNADSSIHYAGTMENGTLSGTGNFSLEGHDGNNILTGNAGNNRITDRRGADRLDGGAGNDTIMGGASATMIGGLGNDRLELWYNSVAASMQGGQGDDYYYLYYGTGTVTELAGEGNDTVEVSNVIGGTYTLGANVENLMIWGAIGNGNALDNKLTGGSNIANTLNGLGGNDTLDGSYSAGADALNGGDGNDTYIIGSNDVLTETATGGVDTVMASFSYTLGVNFENLVLTGTASINGTGNDAGNVLTGNQGSNALSGGLGDDTYIISFGDTVVENAGAGIDTIQTDAFSGFSLATLANVENLVLTSTTSNFANATGNALNNTLTGTANDNTLDGGAGVDTMRGGAGNDTYVVDNAADVVTENAGEGTDTIQSSVTCTIALNAENIVLTGSNAIDATGNDLANKLTGNAAANVLRGGKGDDTYVVDGLDTVVELLGEGTDTVQSTVDHALGANVENLVLVGYGAVTGTGNALNNTITGSDAANTLAGGAGDDTYVVSYGDTVVENAGEGTDTVQARYDWTLAANLENLVLVDFYSGFAGTGNGLANRITGNTYDNTLDGGAGADTLLGGLGADTYIVDNAGDDVRENAGEGTDRVLASVTHTLAANVENLVLTGAAAIDGSGNALDNQLTGNAAANVLRGEAGNDTLDGGAGADTMIGGSGDDSYLVDSASDTVTELAGEGTDTVRTALTGYALADTVENLTLTVGGTAGSGNAGANVLHAQNGGINTLTGGLGDDTYVIDASDVVIEDAGGGTDTVQVGGTYTLGADLENLTLTGTAAINGTGNALANVLTGNAGANVLSGGLGDDTYVLGAGDVAVEAAGEGVDTVMSDVSQALGSNIENLTLTGTGAISGTGNYADNVITGNAGNNTLDGGGGIDTLRGGAGNDTYSVNSLSTVLEENAGAGTDTVISYIDYTLGSNFENLTLTGQLPQAGTGNALDNVLTGNLVANTLTGLAGNDTLDGVFGADTLIGGTGDDTYVVDNAGDVVVENAGEGVDTVRSKRDYVLGDNLENLTLAGALAVAATGNALDNVITGSAFDNVLDGGAGADTMVGGGGDDSYYVDNAGDVVTETMADGRDTVNSSITFTLAADLENLTLTGTDAIQGTGNDVDNVLIGNAGANTLAGGLGNDTLDGGQGADLLIGGSGADTYRVDNAGDVIVEDDYGSGDTVTSTVDFTLTAGLENLRLAGAARVGTGNGQNNVLVGNGGDDVLDGAAGADSMIGGAGNDTYVVDDANDWVAEYADEGVDEIRSSLSRTQAVNVEVLTLTGTADLSATGTDGNEILRGNAGANALDGSAGVDIVAGGGGADTLVNASGNGALDGGSGSDTLTGSSASELFAGGAGSDTLTLGGGADIISFNKGDGDDTVVGGDALRNDTISLGKVQYSELRLERQGADLLVKVAGTGDVLRLQGWYDSADKQGVSVLQVVVGSSADYAPGSGDPLRDASVKSFDFAQVVAGFDAALAADPGLVEWTPGEALLAGALVGSSDTLAMGGRLAWQYAQDGTIAFTHYLTATTEMADAAFGISAQEIAELQPPEAFAGQPAAAVAGTADGTASFAPAIATEQVYTADNFATSTDSVSTFSADLSASAGGGAETADASTTTQDTLAMRVADADGLSAEQGSGGATSATTADQWAEVDAWASLQPALADGSDGLDSADGELAMTTLSSATDLSGRTADLTSVARIENVAQLNLASLQG